MAHIQTIRARKHFKPGNIVYSSYWRNYDRVIAYEESVSGAWGVRVRECDEKGNFVTGEPERWHCTWPGPYDKVVGGVS